MEVGVVETHLPAKKFDKGFKTLKNSKLLLSQKHVNLVPSEDIYRRSQCHHSWFLEWPHLHLQWSERFFKSKSAFQIFCQSHLIIASLKDPVNLRSKLLCTRSIPPMDYFNAAIAVLDADTSTGLKNLLLLLSQSEHKKRRLKSLHCISFLETHIINFLFWRNRCFSFSTESSALSKALEWAANHMITCQFMF